MNLHSLIKNDPVPEIKQELAVGLKTRYMLFIKLTSYLRLYK